MVYRFIQSQCLNPQKIFFKKDKFYVEMVEKPINIKTTPGTCSMETPWNVEHPPRAVEHREIGPNRGMAPEAIDLGTLSPLHTSFYPFLHCPKFRGGNVVL